MGLRFRKSINLALGLRMNLGLRGLSMSLGPRGSSVNVGSRGAYGNVGIPGSGLSTRTRIGGGSSGRSSGSRNLAGLTVAFRLQDDGTVEIVAENGTALPPRAIKMARAQNEERLRLWLEEKCDHWNRGIDDLLGFHLHTPPPDGPPPDASRREFSLSKPSEPVPMRSTLPARIFKSRREQIEHLNAEARDQHAKDRASWERAREEHEESETARLQLFNAAGPLDAAKVQEYLVEVLGRVEWPRETVVSLEVDDTAHVLASGFSQRADRSTGQVSDEYLFSVRVARSAWAALNFSRVADLDLPSCLGNFDIRRNLTSTGVFKAIEPFTSIEDGA